MQGEGNGENQAPTGEQPPVPPPLLPEGETPNPQNGKGQSGGETDDPKTKIDRDLVKWTRVVAFLTGGLVFAALLQFGAALLQWDTMRSAGVDSGNLVTATNHLVDAYSAQKRETAKLRSATENFAKAMRDEADNTGRLVGQAHESAGYAHVSANAAQGQLNELRGEQRAQIYITAISATDDLKIDDNGATLWVQFTLNNAGRTGADYVEARGEFYPRTDNNAVERGRETCAKPITVPNIKGPNGFEIPQGAPFNFPAWFHMSKENVAVWKQRFAASNPPDKMYVIPMLVGCIDYVSQGRHHQTPFVFEVDEVAPGKPGYANPDPAKGNVPATKLVFPVPPWFSAMPN